ncbi:MAG: hypothetical protein QOH93_3696 [Chloroflexia bacterium]|jgi:hypothetical protein|nr:hypothetical protein [Chloroflexia bacterium]
MSNNTLQQPANSSYRPFVGGLLLSGLAMLGLGLVLAGMVQGVAHPWAGLGFVVSAGLAAVVGASKTSSA